MSKPSVSLFKILVMTLAFAGSAFGAAPSITVMSYNVQNLFDAEHDVEDGEDKEDYTFTPTGTPGKEEYCDAIEVPSYKEECVVDWTDDRVEDKIKQIVKAIKASHKTLPDILGLVEIENESVVKRLAKALGYPQDNVAVTQSPDKRGIDVAVIYKNSKNLEFESKKEYELEGSADIRIGETRNILEVKFNVFGKFPLVVYQAHWPSQSAPAAIRVQVAKEFHKKVAASLRDKDNHVLMMGDFNVIPADYPHPFHTVTLAADNPNRLYDVHDSFWRSSFVDRETKYGLPLGTYYYKPQLAWNLLDHFFVSENLEPGFKPDCQEGLVADVTTYRIDHPATVSEDYTYKASEWPNSFLVGNKAVGIPFEYDVLGKVRKQGYSDHFGISMELISTTNKPKAEECKGAKKYYDNSRRGRG